MAFAGPRKVAGGGGAAISKTLSDGAWHDIRKAAKIVQVEGISIELHGLKLTGSGAASQPPPPSAKPQKGLKQLCNDPVILYCAPPPPQHKPGAPAAYAAAVPLPPPLGCNS